jgi:hypothetical protein
MVNNFIGRDQPEPLGATPPERGIVRHPRGTPAGGRFAEKRIISEPDVDLEEAELAELDGSKAAEEMAKKRDEAIAARVGESAQPVDRVDPDALAIEALEASLRDSISDDHFFDEGSALHNPSQKPAVHLGGRLEMASGSWQYPPSYTDVEQIVDHWARCILHDSSLAAVEMADKYGRIDYFPKYEAEFVAWQKDNPSMSARFRRKNPEVAEARGAEYREWNAYLDRIRYGIGLIPKPEIRDVTRLHAIWLQTMNLPTKDRLEVPLREFVMTSGEVTTILDVEKKYRLSEISPAWFNKVQYSAWG